MLNQPEAHLKIPLLTPLDSILMIIPDQSLHQQNNNLAITFTLNMTTIQTLMLCKQSRMPLTAATTLLQLHP